jgi:hypothetical protein
VEGRLLLDVIVAEGTAVLELLAGEDQALLIGGDPGEMSEHGETECKGDTPFLVLDLGLDIVDSVRRFDFESDGFARQAVKKSCETKYSTARRTERTSLRRFASWTPLSVQRIQRWSL